MNNHRINVMSNFITDSDYSLKPTKTDKIDAKTIAQFSSFFNPHNSQNPFSFSPFFELKTLSRQLEFISSIIQKTKTEIKRILFVIFPEIHSHFNIFSKSFLNILINFPSAAYIRENSDAFISNFTSITHRNVKFTPQQIIQSASSSIGINSKIFEYIIIHHIKILIFLENIKKEIKNSIEKKPEQIDHPYINIATTIKGIGKVIATQFFSEIGDIKRFASNKKIVCYIGFDPVIKQSGKYKGEWHISKRGNKHLRRIVYIMASNVIKNEEKFKNFYLRVCQKGKTHKQKMDFSKVMNLRRVNNRDIKIVRREEMKEWEIVNRGGFHKDKSRGRVRAERIKEIKQRLKTGDRLFKRFNRGEGIRGLVFNSNGKGIFRNINTNEMGEDIVRHRHKTTPPLKGGLLRIKWTGTASESILQNDTGLKAQSTYLDLRKQETDSFSGFCAQDRMHSPVPFVVLLNILFSFYIFTLNIQNLIVGGGDNL